MAYALEIKNIGKEPKLFQVFGDDGLRRPAKFENYHDAQECVRVLSLVTQNSALEYILIRSMK